MHELLNCNTLFNKLEISFIRWFLGDAWEGQRRVEGTAGEKVIVQRSQGGTRNPSTVVKKITSQSRVVMWVYLKYDPTPSKSIRYYFTLL